jgi:hypothetical protein
VSGASLPTAVATSVTNVLPVPATTVVMPVGPSHEEEFVRDTIDSVWQFLPTARLIVIDDSGGAVALPACANTTVIATSVGYQGLEGQLYRRLSLAFAEALRQPFDLLLRLDTDAVLLGGTFAQRAHEVFRENPRIGALGAYQRNYDGSLRSFSWPAWRIRRMLTAEARHDPRRALRVAQLVLRAYRHGGYVRGEFVQGGATIYSPNAVRALERAGLLDDERLARAGMQEDHIFGLCLRSLGFEMLDFGAAGDDLPFGLTWQGLPASPEQLVAAGKEIVHSTKFFGERGESEIRAVFRQTRRAQQSSANLSSPRR